MSIRDQLQSDLKTAMLNKETVRRDVIRFTQAESEECRIGKATEASEGTLASVADGRG